MTAFNQTLDLINGLVEVSDLLVEGTNVVAIHENSLLCINGFIKVAVNGQDAEFTKPGELVPTPGLLNALGKSQARKKKLLSAQQIVKELSTGSVLMAKG